MNFISKIVHSFSEEDQQFYNELKKILNFSPRNISKYRKAFTHRSIQLLDVEGNPMNYERLEFLGDSILGSVIAAYLYKKVPTASEGYLTQMRSKIVSREHLNELGKELNLIRFVKSNIDQTNVGDNIHGNIFEALIGAIYLDRGYTYCNKFIYDKVIIPYVDISKLEGKIINYKSLLIEWCQKEKKTFHFDTFEDNDSDGERLFGVKFSIDNKVIAKARATSKKKAEEKACQRAYFAFQDKIDKK